jgi:hypothetical protein
MPARELFPIYDSQLEGGLAEALRYWREAEHSTDEIVDLLAGLQIEVSVRTVRRWLADLDI